MGGRRRFGSITVMSDGSYRGRYRVRGKDYYTPRKRTTRAVQADLTKAEAAILDGTWAPPVPRRQRSAAAARLPSGPLFVEEFGEVWLAQLEEAGRSPNTLRSYRSNLNAHIVPALGHRRLRDLTDADVEALYGRMANHAPGTRNSVGRTLSAMLSAAPEGDRPARKLKILSGTGGRGRTVERRALTADELDAVVAGTRGRLRAAVALAGWCSLRSGEVSGLRRRDIDVGAWTVSVSRAVKRDGSGRPVVGPPKSEAGYRTISIPPRAQDVIAAHLEHVPDDPDALLFPGSWGGYVSDRVLRAAVQAGAEAAGVASVTVHELRHTGLTLYGQAGATLADLMARAGHTSAETVMIYQHSSAVRDRELAARMGG